MTGTEAGSKEESASHPSSLRTLLFAVVGISMVVLAKMLLEGFGPAGLAFGVVVALLAVGIILNRYRFGLKTFLIAVTIASIWLGLKVGRDMQFDRVVAVVSEAGGHWKVRDRHPDFPWGLWRERYDLDFYDLKSPLDPQVLVRLRDLAPSSLKGLNLMNSGITDSDLESISHLHDLEFLHLANETYISGERIPDKPLNKITDAGLVHLAKLSQLKGIDLSGTDISDDGLKWLADKSELHWLYLNGTRINGDGFSNLDSGNPLLMLELNGCKLTPDAYRELARLSNLISLGLNNTNTTDEDLSQLQSLSRLGILRLENTNVSDGAIEEFARTRPKCLIER